MGPTIVLDEDLAARLNEEAERTGTDLQSLANEALRRQYPEPFEIAGPFVRSRPGFSFDKIEQLLDEVEGPMRK